MIARSTMHKDASFPVASGVIERRPTKAGKSPTRLHLPHALRILVEAAGEDAALAMALARGGTRMRIPRRPDGILRELVGQSAAEQIVNSLADEYLEIPQAKRVLSLWLKARGWSQERRANALKVARRSIQYWDKGDLPPLPLERSLVAE